MGNNNAMGRFSARRAAAFLGVLGALVMSSGIALMVAATPANAAQEQHVPVGVCHATSSDTHPYVFIVVDDDSTAFKGHLMHRDHPNKVWKSAQTWNGHDYVKGDPKRDYIATYTDSDGVEHVLDGNVNSETCPGDSEEQPQDLVATANVTFADATCAAPTVADSTATGDNVTFEILSGSKTPGSNIVVRALANDNASFADESNYKDFSHAYPTVDVNAAPCKVVSTPTTTSVSPPKAHVKAKTKAKAQAAAVTPTVVHAGLTSVSAQDMRGEQGLALMVAGMVMLVAAGGVGFRVRGAASRI